jgi:hypothetical protein
MGLFGKSRKQELEDRFIDAQRIYLDKMNPVMDKIIAANGKASLPKFWHLHQLCANAATAPFGVGAPDWIRHRPPVLKETFWDFAWAKWGQYVVTEGFETWTYPSGQVNKWNGSRVLEAVDWIK